MPRPACAPGACARTCAPRPPARTGRCPCRRPRHPRQHALAQVAQAGFLSEEVVIGSVHLREQGVVGVEGLPRAGDLGIVIADAQAGAEAQLRVNGAEDGQPRLRALEGGGGFLGSSHWISPFNWSESPETVPQFRK